MSKKSKPSKKPSKQQQIRDLSNRLTALESFVIDIDDRVTYLVDAQRTADVCFPPPDPWSATPMAVAFMKLRGEN